MRRYMQVLWFIMLVCVFSINLCYAEPTEKSVGTKQAIPSDSPASLDVDKITIPTQYGSIIETHKGTNGKLIVHIQDAHANYEAQKNIAGIIETLITGYNINLILREGGITDKDYTYIRDRAPLEERKQKADELLKKAIIAGEDYLNIASDLPMHFQGVEDRNLYNENSDALVKMDNIKGVASEYVNNLTAASNSLKPKIYNSDLQAMDKAKKDYENEIIGLPAYYKILDDLIKKKNIAIEEFQNFAAFIKGGIKDLNVNNLFKEELLIENKIHEAISENEDQKALYKISTALSIMDKMLNIKMVPEEYDYFLKNKKDFDPQAWANFLKEKSGELGLGLDISSNYYAVSDNMPIVERFYETAVARDKVFIKKSEETMEKNGVKSAVLKTGGFHTPKLTQLLNEAGYSYIVISPKVTTKTDDELYRSTLKWSLPTETKEGGK